MHDSDTHIEKRLQVVRRRLSHARAVAVGCAGLLLVVANTEALPANASFVLAAGLILCGGASMVVGVCAAIASAKLEAQAAKQDSMPFERLLYEENSEASGRTDA
jgi:hypothetical protein